MSYMYESCYTHTHTRTHLERSISSFEVVYRDWFQCSMSRRIHTHTHTRAHTHTHTHTHTCRNVDLIIRARFSWKTRNHVTHEWVMSRMNQPCHLWMSHVPHTRKNVDLCIRARWAAEIRSQDKHDWVMSHMNESCHTWMSHVTYEWVMSHMIE